MPIDSCRSFLRAHSIRLSWVSQFRSISQPRSLAGSKVQSLRVEYRSKSLARQKFETQIVCRCLSVQTRGLQIDGKIWSQGFWWLLQPLHDSSAAARQTWRNGLGIQKWPSSQLWSSSWRSGLLPKFSSTACTRLT